jgi:hypothetical protein
MKSLPQQQQLLIQVHNLESRESLFRLMMSYDRTTVLDEIMEALFMHEQKHFHIVQMAELRCHLDR